MCTAFVGIALDIALYTHNNTVYLQFNILPVWEKKPFLSLYLCLPLLKYNIKKYFFYTFSTTATLKWFENFKRSEVKLGKGFKYKL